MSAIPVFTEAGQIGLFLITLFEQHRECNISLFQPLGTFLILQKLLKTSIQYLENSLVSPFEIHRWKFKMFLLAAVLHCIELQLAFLEKIWKCSLFS